MTSDVVTVVLVDDSPDMRVLVRTRLRIAGGFDVVAEGATGTDAVELAATHQPDLLVLDMSMPGMDGLDALRHIPSVAPRTAVVLFSGFEEPALAEQALAAGARAFIPKSAPVDELAERLRAAVTASTSPSTTGPSSAPGAARPGSVLAPDRTADVGLGSASADLGWNTEGVLAEQADGFPQIFAQAAIGMATLTLTGRLVRANNAFHRLIDVPAGALTGTPLVELADLEHQKDIESALASLNDGRTSSAIVEHQLVGAELAQWVSTTFALVRDSAGNPLYLFVQMQDVSEQRAAEVALRRSEERFRLLVETVRDYGIFMLDPAGRVASWNAGAERIKGYTSAEIVGKHFRTFYTPEDQQRRHPEHELEVAAIEGRYIDEGWRVRKDGTRFWANVTITALRGEDGELVGYAKVTRDVTERERLSIARAEANRAAELLAIIAHELRSPVGVITGGAQTLERHWEQLETADRLALLRSLASGGKRVRLLVDDLLTASRLEARAIDVRPEAVDVRALVAEAVLQATVPQDSSSPTAADVAPQQQAPVVIGDIPADMRVLADPDRLHQIVVNFVTNAVRYGEPPVVVSATSADGTVTITVSDHGPGVPESLSTGDAVFQRFAPGRDRRGTGLGLFIVRELARVQGGDAAYERVDGTTRFSVTLPAAPS